LQTLQVGEVSGVQCNASIGPWMCWRMIKFNSVQFFTYECDLKLDHYMFLITLRRLSLTWFSFSTCFS
jgi:hypothetical protein